MTDLLTAPIYRHRNSIFITFIKLFTARGHNSREQGGSVH